MLSRDDDNRGEVNNEAFGFIENKLARRMIGALKTKCQVPGCDYETTIGDIAYHWRKCPSRDYVCSLCDKKLDGKESFKTHIFDNHE